MCAKKRIETVPVSCEDTGVGGDTGGESSRELTTQVLGKTRIETVPMSCEDTSVGGDTDRDSSREL